MVRVIRMKRIAFGVLAASLFLALAGCPSPFLTAIKQVIARYPFTATSYSFLRQWGNAHPEWAFSGPIARSDIAGNVYVADSTFRIRKFNQNGALQTYYNVNMPSFIFSALFDMAIDPTGNMFVATGTCLFGCGSEKVQEYDSSGNPVGAPWGTFGSGTITLATDASGNVYIADSSNNNVQKYTSGGQYVATFTTTSPALSGPIGIAYDGTNLEVTDTGNNRVVVLSTSGTVQTSWTTTSGTATALSGPSGIAYDFSTHTVYVVDKGNSRVVATDTSGVYKTTWGAPVGTGNGHFTTPTSVAVDAATNIYVTDTGANVNNTGRIQKFAQGIPPTYQASWAETSSAGGNGVFSYPEAVAFDSAGNAYVADALNNRIEKFDPSGNFLLQWGTWGASQPFGFSTGCYGIAVDSSGKVYVSDGGNSQVEEFNASGGFIKVIGNGVIGTPRGVGVDSSGNVYIADSTHYTVQVFTPNSVPLRSWGSNGTGNGQFGSPYGLAVDGSGNVWVTDTGNNNVQEFDSKGNFLLALGGATYGSAPGQFLYPVGVAADQVAGDLYVVDFGNRRVQKFDSSGNYLTQLDTSGTPDGFSYPYSCAINPSGQVIVSDYEDGLVIEYAPVLK
jgi:tripartite motif-containing protein 71